MSKPKNMTPEQEAEYRERVREIAKRSYCKNRESRCEKVRQYKKTIRPVLRCTGTITSSHYWGRCKTIVDRDHFEKHKGKCAKCFNDDRKSKERWKNEKRRFFKWALEKGYCGRLVRGEVPTYYLNQLPGDWHVVKLFEKGGIGYADAYFRTGHSLPDNYTRGREFKRFEDEIDKRNLTRQNEVDENMRQSRKRRLASTLKNYAHHQRMKSIKKGAATRLRKVRQTRQTKNFFNTFAAVSAIIEQTNETTTK
jgi:hypothetical protein